MRLISRRCDVCGARLGPFDRTCRVCGLSGEATRLSRWQPAKGDLATRIDVRNPGRTLGGGLIVERGQVAVLAVAGGRAATLQPRSYRFDDALLRDLISVGAAKRLSLTFVVTRDVTLRFRFDDLTTSEHLPLKGSGSMVIRVARPAVFLQRLVAGRQHYTEHDLCRALAEPMTDAMSEAVRDLSAFEIDQDRQTRSRLAARLEHLLGPTLDGMGLEFVELKSAGFVQEGLEQERRDLGEVLLAERQLDVMERRVAAWEKRSELVNRLAAAETRRQQELADLKRSLEARATDQDLIRQQMREKMEIQHQLELRQLRGELGPPADAPASPADASAPHRLRRAAAAYATAGAAPVPPVSPPKDSVG